MKSKRTKTSCLVKNILVPEFKNLLIEKLNNTKFSIIMDETTDCDSIKQCAFSVTYYCKGTQVSFLEMVECKKGDDNHLFEVLKDMMSSNSITTENLVGFCSDKTNVMAGSHNSIFTKLKQDIRQICLLTPACSRLAPAITFTYPAPGRVKNYQRM